MDIEFGSDWLDEEQPSDAETPEPIVEEPETSEVAEPEAETPNADPVVTTEPKQVPLGALEAERKRRQEAERRVAEYERAAPPQQPAPIPDAYEDPEGFNRYTQDKFAQTEWNLRAGMSERFAIKEHGAELVKTATEWGLETASRDPGFAQQVMADPDPVGLTIQKYQQSRTLESLGGKSFEDAAREHAIAQGWIVSPEAPQPSSLKPSSPKPPRGLSQVPGSGNQTAPAPDMGDVFSANGLGLRK